MAIPKVKLFLGCVAISTYLVLLSAGMLLDSRPYREVLMSSSSVGTAQAAVPPGSGAATTAHTPPARMALIAFAAAMVLYTPTNVAFLALLAGFLGGCASQITYARDGGATLTDEQARFRTENPFASMMRSFVVYLAFIAGTYVITNEPFANATADQYVRLAGTISFFAFVVGYDPTKIQDFLGKLPALQRK
jgi:hypothetical protein